MDRACYRGSEQRDHLRDRATDGTVGVHSGKPVLYRRICVQHPIVGEREQPLAGGPSLVVAALDDIVALNFLSHHPIASWFPPKKRKNGGLGLQPRCRFGY